ncbi:MAG: hypothetical protein JRE47_12235 [Deltaproteobacteria bacterium]|nr:hypothetical protein [Deltaproteobacteria bacterium]
MKDKNKKESCEGMQVVLREPTLRDPTAQYIASNEKTLEILKLEIETNGELMKSNTFNLAIKLEYTYAILGLFLGLSSIIFGSILCLNGVVGSTSWTANFIGAESSINDAAPGVVLFIVGLFMIWVTKPKTSIKNVVEANKANAADAKSRAAD